MIQMGLAELKESVKFLYTNEILKISIRSGESKFKISSLKFKLPESPPGGG